jgi:hypothetical protein
MRVKRYAYRIFMGKSQGKMLVGRHRRTWEANIKINLREKLYGAVDWIDLAQDRDQERSLVNTVMNLWVQNIETFLVAAQVAPS